MNRKAILITAVSIVAVYVTVFLVHAFPVNKGNFRRGADIPAGEQILVESPDGRFILGVPWVIGESGKPGYRLEISWSDAGGDHYFDSPSLGSDIKKFNVVWDEQNEVIVASTDGNKTIWKFDGKTWIGK